MMQIKTALFWVITQRVVVISHWRFGTTYWSHLQGSGRILEPWRWKRSVVLKCRYEVTTTCCVITMNSPVPIIIMFIYLGTVLTCNKLYIVGKNGKSVLLLKAFALQAGW